MGFRGGIVDLSDLADRSHSDLTGIGVNDHHARDHAASHQATGADDLTGYFSRLAHAAAHDEGGVADLSAIYALLDSTGAVQSGSITTGSIAGAATADVTLTWDEAFDDATYIAVANVLEATGDLEVVGIVTKVAASITVKVRNNNAVTARTGTLQGIARDQGALEAHSHTGTFVSPAELTASEVAERATSDGAYLQVKEGPLGLSRYTTTDDASADVSTEVQAWLTAIGTASGKREGLVPHGRFRVDSPLTIPNPSGASNPSGRAGGITLRGANMYASVLDFRGTGYALSGNAEALNVADLCVKSSTGGGFQLTQGGNTSFNRFFMDGCGATYYGIHSTIAYPLTIDGCRFWNNGTDYQGGGFYVDGALGLDIRSTFISRMMKNGPVNVIRACFSPVIHSLMVESTAVGSAFTNQSMIQYDGTNQGGGIVSLYTEGQWNNLIELTANTSMRGMHIGTIYALHRDDGAGGDPDCKILKNTGVALSTPLTIQSLVFESQSVTAPSGSGVLIDDPLNSIRVNAFRNTSAHANQSGRALKERPDPSVGARAYHDTTQVIGTSSTTPVAFNQESFDTHAFHSTVTNNPRFTIPAGKGGTYQCTGQVRLVGTGGNRRAFSVRKNGATVASSEIAPPTSASTILRMQVTDTLELVAGDYIEFAIFQDSGGNLSTGGGEAETWGSVVKVGPHHIT